VVGVAALVRQQNPGFTVAQVVSAIINNATTGVVGGAGTGSPNRLLFSIFGAANPGNDVFFDDFETARGWALAGTNTATTGLWERGNPAGTTSGITLQNNTTPSGVNALVTGAAAGASAGANDVDGGTTTIDSPAITLPAGTINLSFAFYFAHLNNSGADDFFRAFVVNSAGTATQVFQEVGTAANDAGTYTTQTMNISQFAGQTIRIRFQAADNGTGSLVEASVDNVRITQQ
jgi:hypothetical protein